jgi:hexosaminidase
MKLPITGLVFAALTATVFAAGTGELAVIPLPQKMERQPGAFRLSPDTRIWINPGAAQTAEQLAAPLRQSTGWPLKISRSFFSDAPRPNGILLTTRNARPSLGAEGYELRVTTNSIVLRAPAPAGLFYGVQTLLELLPPEIFSTNATTNVDWRIPCVSIQDWPRFPWRGLMLDVSRHFYYPSEVEKILDAMAWCKLNRFHWHLTDDQGWRIEIKKYPKLTQTSAWRPGVGFGLDPQSTTAYGPDGRYGGFYTPADIRKVVQYAAARHITIVPEIEMPGHATAVLAAYPQFSCTGGPFTLPLAGGVFHGIYDPANPATFKFLDDVLAEVCRLFPGPYVHLGGDEVPKDSWKKSPACQALMKREGLKNEEELQSWFIRRMEKTVNAHGKTLLGWSEILQGGLAHNAVVMDWIGGATEAAGAGHDVVMTPTKFCYLDYYQSTNHAAEPRAIGGFLPLEKVYAFEPVPARLAPEFQVHILGGQCNLWTEYIPSLARAEYMLFPRACALAEVTWSAKTARDFPDFSQRLQVEFQRFDQQGVNYRRSP